MAWRDWIKDDPPLTGKEGHWDSPGRILALGILLPLILLAWIVIELYVGTAWIPGKRGGVDLPLDEQPVAFCGAILCKAGVAALAVSAFVIGNHRRLGWHWEKFALGCLIVIGLGIVLLFGGMIASLVTSIA